MKSSNDQLDLRVQRTDKFLWDALIALLAERDFESITVTDICTQAMVHRTTFYKHYEDKYRLLEHGIEEEIHALFASVEEKVKKPVSKETEGHTQAWLIAIFEHVFKQKNFYRLMLCDNGFSTFGKRLRKALAEHLERHFYHKWKTLALPIALYAQLHAASLVTMLAWWLENDCPYPPAEMIKHIHAHIDLI